MFDVLHQLVDAVVDLNDECLSGFTEITLQPSGTGGSLASKLNLNCRQLSIHRVLLNGVVVPFEYSDYLGVVVPPSSVARDLDSYDVFYRGAHSACARGGLCIAIPPVEDGASLVVRVEFSLEKPRAGIHFILPTEKCPYRTPHAYTSNEDGGPCCWLPTIESVGVGWTWSFALSVRHDLVVVATGALVSKVKQPDHPITTYSFHLGVPTSPYDVGFAVGPFIAIPDPNQSETDPHAPDVYYFCLPGYQAMAENTTRYTRKMLEYFRTYLDVKTFPFPNFCLVFVEQLPDDSQPLASLLLCSASLLYPKDVLDKTHHTTRVLANGIAQQWFGCLVRIKEWSDVWLVYGITQYLSFQIYREIFGKNELDYYLNQEFVAIRAMDDAGDVRPLYTTSTCTPVELKSSYAKRKSPLVMCMLEKAVGSDAFHMVLRLSLRDESGVIRTRMSTRSLKKSIKKVCGRDIQSFSKRWISSTGYLNAQCGFWYSKKRHNTEFALRQILDDENSRLFTGAMTIRVHELDSICDHLVSIEERVHEFAFPCHSKVHQRRKKNGDESVPGPLTSGMSIQPPQDDSMMGSWRIPPAKYTNASPVRWVRIDPEHEWYCRMALTQPEMMWVSQLEHDLDVTAQLDALNALARDHKTPTAIAAINRMMRSDKVFYRVRCAAAMALSQSASRDTSWQSLNDLLHFYSTSFATDKKGNRFSDFARYQVKMGVIRGASLVRDTDGSSPIRVFQTLLGWLAENNNSNNEYSDSFLVATLVEGLANASNVIDTRHLEQVVSELTRQLEHESLMPSHENVICLACLRGLSTMQRMRVIPFNLELFMKYTRPSNYQKVRVAALEAICEHGIQHDGVLDHLIGILRDDRDGYVKHALASAMMKVPPGFSPDRWFAPFRERTERNAKLVEDLWGILNSPAYSFDARLRWSIMKLYRTYWGYGQPECLGGGQCVRLSERVREHARPLDPEAMRSDYEQKKAKRKKIEEAEEQEHWWAPKGGKKEKKDYTVKASSVGMKLKISIGGTELRQHENAGPHEDEEEEEYMMWE